LFSKPFVEVIARAINEGRLSMRRAADLLDMPTDDLAELCRTYGVEAPVEL
jgi:predicted HTH domain antitoxin